jgi:hypothetical protein
MKTLSLLAVVAAFLLLLTSCGQQKLEVVHMPAPDFPLEARSRGMQGVVLVNVAQMAR